MILARVIGNVVSTCKDRSYGARKMLFVQPVEPWTLKPAGRPFVTLDVVGAGEGEIVLVLKEGSGAQQVCGETSAPIGSAVVAIVDEIKPARRRDAGAGRRVGAR